ncbi:uracil phosphoribosyltransferase [Thalassoporum mexicanum PCC 7367]|uniref:uracil phosphoribosyltransferase n=1 Tax=Thalassoporum mexicanum TaxID=3457544 RepID=UPI00029FCCA2|nr:uracil phosphoribosyltransferase [Pseudanabaena sp. PCC 7367]AFY70865.1 uracil phosphoribosyltransferase [Pseudanabaena sp. PCC 7367]
MAQLRVYVPPHPLIRHWLTVARDKNTPVALFRTAMKEIGHWLTYEAIREWLPVQEVAIETPLQAMTGQFMDVSTPIAIVPILRAGLAIMDGCQELLPTASIYHLGWVRDEETLEASCYLNRLPDRFAPQTRVLIAEPMLATGGTIMSTLEMLVERGADPAMIRIICVVCAPPALQKINQQYPGINIFAANIDEVVDQKGWIVPGLGDAGDRAFGTS